VLAATGRRSGFSFGPGWLRPLAASQTKTLLDGWLRSREADAHDGAVRYDFTFWVTPLLYARDLEGSVRRTVEGENFIQLGPVDKTNTAIARRAKLLVEDAVQRTARIVVDLAAGKGPTRGVKSTSVAADSLSLARAQLSVAGGRS